MPLDSSELVGAPYTSSLYVGYGIAGMGQSTLEVDYAVEESEIAVSGLDVAYEISIEERTEWEPTVAPISPWTQIVGNKYPHWHAARRRYGSDIQRFLNAMSGTHLEGLYEEMARFRMNRFVSTADLTELASTYSVAIPRRSVDPHRVNLLTNADFSAPGLARLGTPWAWSDGLRGSDGIVSLSMDRALLGTYGVRLEADTGETVHIQQKNQIPFYAGESASLSVYYAGMAPTLEAAPHEAYLALMVQYADGTTEMWREGLERGTDGAWTRAELTVTFTREVYCTTTIMCLDNRFGDQDLYIDVGGIQLERGDRVSPWTPRANETGFVVVQDRETVSETVGSNSLSFDRAQRRRIRILADYEHLDRESFPVRMSLAVATTETATSKARLGFQAEKDGMRFSQGWRVVDGQVVTYNADIGLDESYNEYQIADLFADHRFDEEWYISVADLGVTQTCEALTIYRGFVWVVAKETYRGRTFRVLKVCKPGVRWDETDHLECVREIPIENTDDDCTFLGFVDGESDKILLTIDGVEYVGTLSYDDGVVVNSGLLLTRTYYAGRVLAV